MSLIWFIILSKPKPASIITLLEWNKSYFPLFLLLNISFNTKLLYYLISIKRVLVRKWFGLISFNKVTRILQWPSFTFYKRKKINSALLQYMKKDWKRQIYMTPPPIHLNRLGPQWLPVAAVGSQKRDQDCNGWHNKTFYYLL